MANEYKGEIAYFLKKSWYHNKKEVLEDGTIKYGRVGGFKTPEEAEKSYYEMQQIFEEKMRNRITPSINKEIMIKDYLIYWFENIYSSRIESTTKMLTSYTLYKIIIPNIKYDIKLRLVTTNYLNELLEEVRVEAETKIVNIPPATLDAYRDRQDFCKILIILIILSYSSITTRCLSYCD